MKSDQVRLNNGITIPLLGMGTYSFENDRKSTENAVHLALKMGYRHFDTAHIYGSEPAIGNALNDAVSNGVVTREDLYVSSKLWGSHHHDPVSALQNTLRNMGMEYIDMYLVHWPVKLKPWVNDPIPKEDEFEPLCMEMTWTGMEKCLEMGLCRDGMKKPKKLNVPNELRGRHDLDLEVEAVSTCSESKKKLEEASHEECQTKRMGTYSAVFEQSRITS